MGERCHVSGRGLTNFGTRFSQRVVSNLATSSVQLVMAEPQSPKGRLASGTLIALDYSPPAGTGLGAAGIVLCAAHSIAKYAPPQMTILMSYELDAKTAPPGYYEKDKNRSGWVSGNALATTPQGKVLKIIKRGDELGLDYALLFVGWDAAMVTTDGAGNKALSLPRPPILPPPGRTLTSELLLVGHPWHDPYDSGPTQATTGGRVVEDGPNPASGQGNEYGYASFQQEGGFSGGGVFNENGELVGVLKGTSANNQPTGVGFVNLGRGVDAFPKDHDLLRSWLTNPGAPLIQPGDYYVLAKP
jgi:hypothetical protein